MFRKFTRSNDGPVPVQMVAADAMLEERLRAVLEGDTRFALETVFRTIGEAEEKGAATAPQSILLVELDPERADELAAMERIMRDGMSGRAVIAIIDDLNEATVRKLLHLHVADLLSKSGSPQDLLKACERAIRPEGKASRYSGATCYAFISAGGGAGNTSIAIQSAFVIARKTGQFQSTCLIDMDFQGGVVADYLDVPPNLQLDEIAPSPERLDTQLLEVMLSRHPTGLSVLAAGHALRLYDVISGNLVTRMLDMASLRFESVILDMPRVWLPWSENVLRGSDRVFIVTEMTVPGLRQARRLVQAIRTQCGEETDVSVIVNRFRQSLLGGVNSVRKKDAEDVLGGCLAGFVSEDYRLVREAIDRGVPLYQISKSNKIDKDLETILFQEKKLPVPAKSKKEPPRIELSAAKA